MLSLGLTLLAAGVLVCLASGATALVQLARGRPAAVSAATVGVFAVVAIVGAVLLHRAIDSYTF